MTDICTSTHSWEFFINTSASEASLTSLTSTADQTSFRCQNFAQGRQFLLLNLGAPAFFNTKNMFLTYCWLWLNSAKRHDIYIYIQTYIHIYILNNEVANPVNSGLNIGYTILMYLICQTTVSNGGILLPHNWEKGLGRRKQYVGTSPGHRHWQCLEGLLFQRRQMIEAKHRDHPSLSTVT